MALSIRLLCKNLQFLKNITKPVEWSAKNQLRLRTLSSSTYFKNNLRQQSVLIKSDFKLIWTPLRYCSTQSNKDNIKPSQPDQEKKPGLIQRFKQMYRDYWYVLVPVHLTTSAAWLGGFYYAVRR